MYRLRLFGGVQLDGPSGPLAGRVVQRRQQAFLALLASAPGGGLSRDKLGLHLWPDSDPERVRRSVSDALYILRHELGESAIRSAGDGLRLDETLVWSDTRAFADAIARGDLASAVDLYCGPFLDGFHLRGAVEFEHWRDREAQRFRDAAIDAARRLASEEETVGNIRGAVHWTRQALGANPYDESTIRYLVGLLETQGDTAGARLAFAEYERRLGDELGVTPAPQTRAAVAALPGRPPAPPTDPLEVHREADSGVPNRIGARRRWGFVAAGSALIAAGAVALSAALLNRSDANAALAPRSIAVLPFQNVGADPENEYFSAGITNEITTRLSRIAGLSVVSRTSSVTASAPQRPVREIARELGVAYVLEGAVQREGNRLRITAELIDAGSDRHLWSETFDRGTGDVFFVQAGVAQRVAEALAARVTAAEARGIARAPTHDVEAYTLYLKGRFVAQRRTAEALRQAGVYFRQAVQRDSAFAAAWAGLADTYILRFASVKDLSREAAVDSAEGPARRALALDDELAEAHAAIGGVSSLKWDRTGHLRAYRRAVELNPSYAYGQHLLAHALAYVEGRLDEAVDHVRRAIRSDPLAPVYANHLAALLYLARDYEAAVRQYEATFELAPEFKGPRGRAALARALVGARRHNEARVVIDTAMERYPGDPDLLLARAIVHAAADEQPQALALLASAQAAGADSISLGATYAALGRSDRALTFLSARIEDFGVIKTLSWDPRLDPLRRDPRFAALLRRIAAEWRVPHLPSTGTSHPRVAPWSAP